MVKKKLTSESALDEAAGILRKAASFANKKEDIEMLLNIVAAWVEISARINKDEDEKTSKEVRLGFVHTHIDDEEEDEDGTESD